MIIVDTNIVSEFMKDAPHAKVMAWARGLGPTDLAVTVVTIEEVERGLGRLPKGGRRKGLEGRWATLMETFAEAIVSYDEAAARATAQLLVSAMDRGRAMSLADAQIAGICLVNGSVLATRNVKDFDHVEGLTLVNPFDSPEEN